MTKIISPKGARIMSEQLYAIPVNDAFDSGCECPICAMYHKLETDAVEYTMGPSYMEDDTRSQTDRYGFCAKHVMDIYNQNNRLGMAWVMKTHYDKVISEVEKATPSGPAKLLKKEMGKSKLVRYLDEVNHSCFICRRIDDFFARYVDTVFVLYKNDEGFRRKFAEQKGFCTPHYELLLNNCTRYLSGTMLEDFVSLINRLYLDNMKRVRDDLAWFINKFDYNYQNEPWYNARDAVIRSMIKTNGVFKEDKPKG